MKFFREPVCDGPLYDGGCVVLDYVGIYYIQIATILMMAFIFIKNHPHATS